MAKWPDLSAHGLSLFMVNTNKKGVIDFYILPIYGKSPSDYLSDIPDDFKSVFSRNQDDVLVSRLDLNQGETFPSPKAWLMAFPGSMMRETQNGVTFNPSQKSFDDIINLPVRSPWVWRPKVASMLETNEIRAQALGDGNPAVLCKPDEVSDSNVAFPTMFVSMKMDTVTGLAQPDDHEEKDDMNESMGDDMPEDDADEPMGDDNSEVDSVRKDFGEYVPGDAKNRRGIVPSHEVITKKMDNLLNEGSLLFKDMKSNEVEKLKKIVKDISSLSMTNRFLTQHKNPQGFREVIETRIANSVASSLLSSEKFSNMKRWYGKHYIYDTGFLNEFSRAAMTFEGELREIRARIDSLPDVPTVDSVIDFLQRKTQIIQDGISRDEGQTVFERMMSIRKTKGLIGYGSHVSRVVMDAMNIISSDDEFYKINKKLSDEQKDALKAIFISSIEGGIRNHWDEVFSKIDIDNVYRREKGYIPKDESNAIGKEQFINFLSKSMADFYYDNAFKYKYLTSYYITSGDLIKELDQKEVVNKFDNFVLRSFFELAEIRRDFVQSLDLSEIKNELIDSVAIENVDETKEEPVSPEFIDKKDFVKLMNEINDDKNDTDTPDSDEITETAFRKGPATLRGDKDVSEAMFCETFGFRAVRYGNYMSDKQRQESLNAAFDSYCDILTIFGISDPKIMSMPQKQQDNSYNALAIAFGARGRGGRRPASAHYEPDEHIMNYTKRNGAGTVMHETLHAMVGCILADQSNGAVRTLDSMSSTWIGKTMFAPAIDCAVNKNGDNHTDNDMLKKSILKYVEATNKALIPVVFEGFISNGVQNRILWSHCKTNGCPSYAPTRDVVLEFQSNLKKMIPAVQWIYNSTMELSEKVVTESTDASDEASVIRELNTNLRENFFDRFYVYTGGNRVAFSETGSVKVLVDALDAVSPDTKASNKEIALLWTKSISPSFWSFSKKFANKKTYEPNHNKLSGFNTNYYMGSKIADGARKDPYYANNDELMARLSEVTALKLLHNNGIENTYLVKDEGRYLKNFYPMGYEHEVMTDMFTNKLMPEMIEHIHGVLNLSMEAEMFNQNSFK